MLTPGLRHWRDHRVLSMRELAVKAGVAYRTVWRLENGFPAEARTIRKLAEALNVEPHQLTPGQDQAPGQQAAA